MDNVWWNALDMTSVAPPPLGATLPIRSADGAAALIGAVVRVLPAHAAVEKLRLDDHSVQDARLRLRGARLSEDLALTWDLEVPGDGEARVIGMVETSWPARTLPDVPETAGPSPDARGVTLGLAGRQSVAVTPDLCTSHVGETHTVLGTPDMVRVLERCAAATIRPYLAPGVVTVGVEVDVDHFAPAHLGVELAISCELVAIRGRRLSWDVMAEADGVLVGAGQHAHQTMGMRQL